MITITSYNIKGGVGKTAAAVNLAYLSAKEGFRTLICDLDPQGAASFYFRIEPSVKKGYRIFLDDSGIDDHTKASNFENLNVLPSDFSYRKLDVALEATENSKVIFEKKMLALEADYDIVFLDSPPNLTLLTEHIFHATNFIVNPVVPTTLSLRTLGQLNRFIKKKGRFTGELLPFFSMVEGRKKLHSQIVQHTLAGDVPNLPLFLKTSIPYLSDVEKMGSFRAPLGHVRPRSRAAMAYQNLWENIKEAAKF